MWTKRKRRKKKRMVRYHKLFWTQKKTQFKNYFLSFSLILSFNAQFLDFVSNHLQIFQFNILLINLPPNFNRRQFTVLSIRMYLSVLCGHCKLFLFFFFEWWNLLRNFMQTKIFWPPIFFLFLSFSFDSVGLC